MSVAGQNAPSIFLPRFFFFEISRSYIADRELHKVVGKQKHTQKNCCHFGERRGADV
jgi:hypothetical protein